MKYKHKFTYVLYALIQITLAVIWTIGANKKTEHIVPTICGGLAIRELYWFFKDWSSSSQ